MLGCCGRAHCGFLSHLSPPSGGLAIQYVMDNQREVTKLDFFREKPFRGKIMALEKEAFWKNTWVSFCLQEKSVIGALLLARHRRFRGAGAHHWIEPDPGVPHTCSAAPQPHQDGKDTHPARLHWAAVSKYSTREPWQCPLCLPCQ